MTRFAISNFHICLFCVPIFASLKIKLNVVSIILFSSFPNSISVHPEWCVQLPANKHLVYCLWDNCNQNKFKCICYQQIMTADCISNKYRHLSIILEPHRNMTVFLYHFVLFGMFFNFKLKFCPTWTALPADALKRSRVKATYIKQISDCSNKWFGRKWRNLYRRKRRFDSTVCCPWWYNCNL